MMPGPKIAPLKTPILRRYFALFKPAFTCEPSTATTISKTPALTRPLQTTIFAQSGSIWRTLSLLVMIVAALVLVPCAADAQVPVVENYTFNANIPAGDGTDIILDKPAGWAVGDLFLVFVSSDHSDGPDWNTKLGWNLHINCGSSSTLTVTGIYWRIANGDTDYEGSTETFTQNINDDLMGWWIRISGVDTSDPIHIPTLVGNRAALCTEQSTTTPDIPGFTTDKDNVLAMWFLTHDGADFRDGGGIATGSGWPTDFVDGHTPSGDSTDIGGGWSQKNMPTQGPTGLVEVDADHSDGNSFVQIGINPVSNSAPGTPTLAETPAFSTLYTADTTPGLGNFSATDPDSDNLEYDIQWDEDYSFGTPVTQNSANFATNGFTAATFASGASVSYTVQPGEALTNGQTYWWRVRARDPSGTNTWTSYSAKRSITIDTSITLDQWFQTTTEQFDSANGNTLNSTQATGNGVKLNGW